MPPLTDPADRYRHLVAELAYYAAAPVRKGGKRARLARIRDMERALAVTVDAMRAACKAMWLESDATERATRWAAVVKYRKQKARKGEWAA